MTVAELKRRLVIGQMVEIVKIETRRNGQWHEFALVPKIQGPRPVVKVQTNAVAFANTDGDQSWLGIPKARDLEGTATGFVIASNGTEEYSTRLTYDWR